jgi:hypothetical protein
LNSNTSACKAGFTVHHVRTDADHVFHRMILPQANRMTICAGEAAHPQPFQGETRGQSPPGEMPQAYPPQRGSGNRATNKIQ